MCKNINANRNTRHGKFPPWIFRHTAHKQTNHIHNYRSWHISDPSVSISSGLYPTVPVGRCRKGIATHEHITFSLRYSLACLVTGHSFPHLSAARHTLLRPKPAAFSATKQQLLSCGCRWLWRVERRPATKQSCNLILKLSTNVAYSSS